MPDYVHTIEEGKEYLRKNWEVGTTCPCCSQVVKLNTYKMSFGHAKVMIEMYKLHRQGKEWVHVNTEIKPQGRQFSEAKHWYLMEAMPNDNPQKHTSGYWRLTSSGERFVLGQITVQKAVKVFNDKRYRQYEDNETMVDIRGALKNRFNYDELMVGFKPYNSQGSLL